MTGLVRSRGSVLAGSPLVSSRDARPEFGDGALRVAGRCERMRVSRPERRDVPHDPDPPPPRRVVVRHTGHGDEADGEQRDGAAARNREAAPGRPRRVELQLRRPALVDRDDDGRTADDDRDEHRHHHRDVPGDPVDASCRPHHAVALHPRAGRSNSLRRPMTMPAPTTIAAATPITMAVPRAAHAIASGRTSARVSGSPRKSAPHTMTPAENAAPSASATNDRDGRGPAGRDEQERDRDRAARRTGT